jgi:plasmid stabilization system protein ParE
MNYDIIFDGSAREDIANAYQWYENQQLKLGDRFFKNIESAFNNIQKNPKAFKKVSANHHQYPMSKFPFVILYEISENNIFIDAVYHTSKNPSKKP